MGANLEKIFHLAIAYQINTPNTFFGGFYCEKIKYVVYMIHF